MTNAINAKRFPEVITVEELNRFLREKLDLIKWFTSEFEKTNSKEEENILYNKFKYLSVDLDKKYNIDKQIQIYNILESEVEA